MRTFIECPCCGCAGAESDERGYYVDGQETICGCVGLAVSCDDENPPGISGECELNHEEDDDE